MQDPTTRNRFRLAALGVILLLLAAIPAASQRDPQYHSPVGTWYLALDATPFGAVGAVLSGLATFHDDGTFLLADAGDFGQAGFTGKHSPQFGAWSSVHDLRLLGRSFRATSLFLEANLDGQVLNWQRVDLELTVSQDGMTMTGTANVTLLPCDDTLPLPSALTCPDPIANASQFVPGAPAPLPVTFSRLFAN